MALEFDRPFNGQQLSVAAGNAVTVGMAGGQLTDNCHTIIVYNPNAGVLFYVGWNVGGVNIATGLDAGAARLPAQTSMTIPVGKLSSRVSGATPAGATRELVVQHNNAGPQIIYITYIYGLES